MAGEEALLKNYRNGWHALRMIRETVETLGPPGVLPSAEAVLKLYGPEPIHEAQAITDALIGILTESGAEAEQLRAHRSGAAPTRAPFNAA